MPVAMHSTWRCVHQSLCRAAAVVALCGASALSYAGPAFSPVVLSGANDVAAVGASAFGQYTVLADTFEDRVEVRDATGSVVRTITRAEMLALCPWMTLDGGPDGPSAVAVSSTGKQVFVSVHDDLLPGDGLGSDAVLRLDLATNTLTQFARADLYDRGDLFPHLASAHFRGALMVGTYPGFIRVYNAGSGAATGSLANIWTLPVGGAVHGITIDRDTSTIFAATETGVYRALMPTSLATAPTWTLLHSSAGIRGLAWGDSFGGALNKGLYIVRDAGGGASEVDFISSSSAYSTTPVGAATYASAAAIWHSIAMRGDGAMILGQDENASVVQDTTDLLLPYSTWQLSELTQVVAFGRGLIDPDGEPAGWVIDADTTPALPRFHPATPDAAAWTVFLLLASDDMLGDAQAQQDVRTILTRYGGLAVDGIAPSRTADGIFRHWIDPATGGVKSGWDPEYATLSTMKIVAAASRSMAYYIDDPVIARAASRVIFRTRNWDAYVRTVDGKSYFKGLAAGGPDPSSVTGPFHEGVIFVEQCSNFGGSGAQLVYGYWLNRGVLPSASYLPGLPITSTANNLFEASFLSIYPALLQRDYRVSSAWRTQVANIRWSNAGWTDDNSVRFSTVFSAGTTRSDWGGYNADSLGNHPGNVTTFTSLMGLSAFGDANPATGAYHAYRRGARQTFRSGASILYRRSDVDRTYVPNSAGLPDVALGALALAELHSPGFLDRVLSIPYQRAEMSPLDVTGDTAITLNDAYATAQSPTDLNGDGLANAGDSVAQANWQRRHEREQLLLQR